MKTINSLDCKITANILHLLAENQRLIAPDLAAKDSFASSPCAKKIFNLIQKQAPLVFVLPAFPAKSPNPTKTASHLPDMGERLALKFLNNLCQKIGQFYVPGAQMLICSDGRVFNDLLNVRNEHVSAYADGMNSLVKQDGLTFIQFFDLDNYFSGLAFDTMRINLMQTFGESLTSLKQRIKIDAAAKLQFNGIHRFVYEDRLPLYPDASKNSVRNQAKEIAYQVILRSNAWSRLIEQCFPDAVRLSIHPQLHDSDKIGIMLLKSEDVWMTPWHSVALFNGEDYRLVKRQEAEKMQATPVFVQEQFSHYVMQG
ncbi:MAG: hypothetical protein K0S11_863 [Gammaproteobacteria bacterium]|jgi:pyoverdine/dityrosine biosynthesis protein Dit1|nr:hypothetical protein [Gammaproteobacteria bacterium]